MFTNDAAVLLSVLIGAIDGLWPRAWSICCNVIAKVQLLNKPAVSVSDDDDTTWFNILHSTSIGALRVGVGVDWDVGLKMLLR